MPVGLGAGGALGIALETAAAPGTWVTPAVWVPIISESLDYTEDRYYSEAIRQQTITNAVAQGYYHIEGDLSMEFDTRLVPYFLHGSRYSVTKTGTGPWVYKFVPTAGAQIPSTNRTLSITVMRNGVGYGYFGCVVTSFEITIDTGILRFNCHVIGTGEATQSPAATFLAPQLLGAAAHTISTGDGPVTSGAISGVTVDKNFNGFTFTANDNGAAQNRIIQARTASYISFGITEAEITTELDFQSRTEYDKFVAAASKKLTFVSSNGANDNMGINVYNSVYDDYTVGLGNWSDIVMATSNFKLISSGGSNPAFDVSVTSGTTNIVPT